ncbi:efflux RND transporter permease subunit, partial [Raoultella ornithinolytica]
GKPAVVLFVYKQPGSNVVETIDGIKAALPQMRAALPGDIDFTVNGDRAATIRASLAETEDTLVLAVGLVVLVVYAFLRS